MANELDFLEALDRYIRDSPLGMVTLWSDLRDIALRERLMAPENDRVPAWTGVLVYQGYMECQPMGGAIVSPAAHGWSERDVQSCSHFRLTAPGREEAERTRHHKRQQGTDAALGGNVLLLCPWLQHSQRAAIERPLRELRNALDAGNAATAIGAAKELVEAAAKVVLSHLGHSSTAKSLPSLVRDALRATDTPDELATSLTATTQRLGELRNVAGSGHGRDSERPVWLGLPHLAAASGAGVASYLLASVPSA